MSDNDGSTDSTIKRAKAEDENEHEVSDGMTTVMPVSQKQIAKKTELDHPVLVAGFPGAGMVGSISTSYIIEQLHMHQIAYVDSDFISPGVIYIGKKLRHPFRLYSNDKGNVCVLVCDAPIRVGGVRSVLNTVVKWVKKYGVKEVIVADGIPIEQMPNQNRQPIMMFSDGKMADDGSYLNYMDQTSPEASNPDGKSESKNLVNAAFIGGIAGGLLASCLSNGIPCRGVLIPSPSGMPDPEGAAIIVESINNIGNDSLSIDVKDLRKKGESLKRQIENLIKEVQKQQQQEPPSLSSSRNMYG